MIWNSILLICLHRRHLRLNLFDPSLLPDAFSSSAVESSLESTLRRDWLRSGKAPRPEHRLISELNTPELVLASFGEADSGAISPAFLTHSPDHANGFVW
jgi:hypothetical protein